MKARRVASLLSAVVGVTSLLTVAATAATAATASTETAVTQSLASGMSLDWSAYRTAPASLTWTQTADGFTGRSGQIFTPNPADEYTITATAQLHRDYWSTDGTAGGYGVFFETALGPDNKDTGYVFQLDRGAGGIRIFQRVNGVENYGNVYSFKDATFPTDKTDPWWTAEHTVVLQVSRVAGAVDVKELTAFIDGHELLFTKQWSTALQPYRFTSTVTPEQNHMGLRAWNTDTTFRGLSAVGPAMALAAPPAKGNATIALSCPEGVVFDGAAQEPCTASVTDAATGELLPFTPEIGYVANTGVGTATVTAELAESEDYLGASASATFEIAGWQTQGFFQPVDPKAVNVVKSGSTVPLKFEVFAGGVELSDPAVVTSFTAQRVSCPGTTGEVDGAPVASTGLRYDPTAGQFVQNWKTPGSSAGQCLRATATLQDGQSLTALFKLK